MASNASRLQIMGLRIIHIKMRFIHQLPLGDLTNSNPEDPLVAILHLKNKTFLHIVTKPRTSSLSVYSIHH